MQNRFVLILGIALGLVAGVSCPLHSQTNTAISLQFNETNLSEALAQIENTFDVVFSYNPEAMEDIQLTTKAEGVELDDLLTSVFDDQPIDFKWINDRYIVLKRNDVPRSLGKPRNYHLCGLILDSLSQEPLMYANIFHKKSGIGVSSDDLGNFQLKGPFGLEDEIEISYVGYDAVILLVKDLQHTPCERIYLGGNNAELTTVEVTDRAIQLLGTSDDGNGFRMDLDKVESLPGWGEPDVLRMVQLLPGISATDESASDLSIRGGTSDQNLVLFDGIPIYHTGHFFGMFSAFNPYVVDNVSVFRGNFGARYGGRVAGIIDIKAKPSDTETMKFGAGLNLISTQTFAQVPMLKKRSALLVGFRRSFTDVIQTNTYEKIFGQVSGNGKIQDQQEDAANSNGQLAAYPLFYFTDFNLKWVFRPNPKNDFGISIFYADDNLDYSLASNSEFFYLRTTDLLKIGNFGTNIHWKRRWSDKIASNFELVLATYSNDYTFSFTNDSLTNYQFRFHQKNEIADLTFRFDNEWKIDQQQQVNFGIQNSRYNVKLSARLENEEEIEEQYFEELMGTVNTLYADYGFSSRNNIDINFGLRMNFLDSFRQSFVEPRLAIKYQPFQDNQLHLKAGAGYYQQFIGQVIQNNDLGIGEKLWAIASSGDIPVLKAGQWSAGATFQKGGWFIDVEYYEKYLNGLTSLNLRFDEPWQNPYTQGTGTVKGLDVLLKKKWKNYNTWLSYTISSVRYNFPGINDDEDFPALQDQRHRINWTHILSFKNFDFSVNWNFSSGSPFTDADGVFESVDDNGDRYHEIAFAPRNSSRLPAYHRLDISGNVNFSSKSGAFRGKAGISIFNLYDRQNIKRKGFFVDEHEGAQDPEVARFNRYMLGFTPNIFAKFEW